ncbi:hypothetical protein MMC22_007075 [Lobaria immixta]|nr:hypothetical protein [Lobaria immixta]
MTAILTKGHMVAAGIAGHLAYFQHGEHHIDRALRGYQDRIKVYQDKLVAQIASFGDQRVNVTKWLNLYSLDVKRDLAFGTSFAILESTDEHWAIKLLNEDIMCTLLEPYEETKPTEHDIKMLRGDSQLIVVAGSDTTATTLTHIFHELARNNEHISRLREEILLHTSSSDQVLDQKLHYLDHLHGVILETLRLHPPIPSALQRFTPPEGLEISQTHIPANVKVWCSQYAIGRSWLNMLSKLATTDRIAHS